jgi:hypothetical protein
MRDRVMFSHQTIVPDADRLYSIYQAWRAAVDQIADVQGLYPTFVMNTVAAGAARVGQTNGIGNVWGLKVEPTICKSIPLVPAPKVGSDELY